MTHLFVPYDLSLKLKELGFDEPCFAFYLETKGLVFASCTKEDNLYPNNNDLLSDWISAPLFSQVFKWFREKYNLVIVIISIDDKRIELGYNLTKNGLIIQACSTYEKAELFSVRKLIEIAKNGKTN